MERDIIGLGKNCFVAAMLKRFGIMKQRDVFDSLGTQDLAGFARQIELNFETFFLSLDNLDFYGQCPEGKRWFVRDKESGILSSHLWYIKQDKHEAFKRFKKLHDTDLFIERLKNTKSPLLLRTNESHTKLEEVMYLREVIEKVRGNDDFVLCVFQDALWAAERDWSQIPSLKTFRITGLYSAYAECYPDKRPTNIDDIDELWAPGVVHPRAVFWRKILDYIFDETGTSIKTRCLNSYALKML